MWEEKFGAFPDVTVDNWQSPDWKDTEAVNSDGKQVIYIYLMVMCGDICIYDNDMLKYIYVHIYIIYHISRRYMYNK